MIRFEWDPAKARTNQRKHGVTFEDAMHVLKIHTPCSSRTVAAKRGNCAGKRSASLETWPCCSRPILFEKKARMK